MSVYVLGGFQTDFAVNWTRSGLGTFELLSSAVQGAIESIGIQPEEIQVAHIGNFASEIFTGQGHLGGLFASVHPAFDGLPTARHEAACASGSIALQAGLADVESGRYDVVCVVGLEMMRNVSTVQASMNLAGAAWIGYENTGMVHPWPALFSRIADEYAERYGLHYGHLMAVAQTNFKNAMLNPNAQTRGWIWNERSFTDDDVANPIVEGRIRRQDCGQITDGAAMVILASRDYAEDYVASHGKQVDDIAVVRGWGHRTAPMLLETKLQASRGNPYVFPHVHQTILDAFGRARIAGVEEVDCIETHDCFTVTEYMAIDHFGITPPGASWQAIEDGRILKGGSIPINPSGGLIGAGHPVGATGVRMVLDAFRQVTGAAGGCQIDGARTVATLNLGGSATTCVSFVIGQAES